MAFDEIYSDPRWPAVAQDPAKRRAAKRQMFDQALTGNPQLLEYYGSRPPDQRKTLRQEFEKRLVASNPEAWGPEPQGMMEKVLNAVTGKPAGKDEGTRAGFSLQNVARSAAAGLENLYGSLAGIPELAGRTADFLNIAGIPELIRQTVANVNDDLGLQEKARAAGLENLYGAVAGVAKVIGRSTRAVDETLLPVSADMRKGFVGLRDLMLNAGKELSTTKKYSDGILAKVRGGDLAGAAEHFSYGMVENLPQYILLGLTTATGNPQAGLALMGAGASSQQLKELDQEGKLSDGMKLANAGLTGLAEFFGEKLGSAKILSRIFGPEAEKVVREGFVKGLKRVMAAGAREGTEEFATQVANNLTDIVTGRRRPDGSRIGVLDGAADAYVLGAGMGHVMGGYDAARRLNAPVEHAADQAQAEAEQQFGEAAVTRVDERTVEVNQGPSAPPQRITIADDLTPVVSPVAVPAPAAEAPPGVVPEPVVEVMPQEEPAAAPVAVVPEPVVEVMPPAPVVDAPVAPAIETAAAPAVAPPVQAPVPVETPTTPLPAAPQPGGQPPQVVENPAESQSNAEKPGVAGRGAPDGSTFKMPNGPRVKKINGQWVKEDGSVTTTPQQQVERQFISMGNDVAGQGRPPIPDTMDSTTPVTAAGKTEADILPKAANNVGALENFSKGLSSAAESGVQTGRIPKRDETGTIIGWTVATKYNEEFAGYNAADAESLAKAVADLKAGKTLTPRQLEHLDRAMSRIEDYGGFQMETGTPKARPPATPPPGENVPDFVTEQQATFSVKTAKLNEQRARQGLLELTPPKRQSEQAVWERAMARVSDNVQAADEILAAVEANPRPFTPEEVFIVDQRLADIHNEWTRSLLDAAQAVNDGRMQEAKDAEAIANDYNAQLDRASRIAKAAGSEWGRAGHAMQRLMNEDYSLMTMRNKATVAKGAPLTTEEQATIVKLAKEIKDLQDKLAETEKTHVEKERFDAVSRDFDRIVQEAEAMKKDLPAPHVLAWAQKYVDALNKRADAARVRLAEKRARMSSGIDPTMLVDLIEIGASHVANFASNVTISFSKWKAKMVEEWGNDEIVPHLDKIWDEVHRDLEAGRAMPGAEKMSPTILKKAVSVVTKTPIEGGKTAPTIEDMRDKLQAKHESGDLDISRIVNQMAQIFVAEDIAAGKKPEREDLLTRLHAAVQSIMPDMTRLDVMDAFSGRGQFTLPDPEQVKAELRDLRAQTRIVGHQMDVVEGKPLPRTGPQRDKMSDVARREKQKLNELMKKYGVAQGDPATQLASVLQARKTYTRNRLADLKAEIAAKERNVTVRTAAPTDPELEAMKAELVAVQAEHDAIFNADAPSTNAERNAVARVSIKKAIDNTRKQIQAGARDGKTPQQRMQADQETTRLRSELASLQNLLDKYLPAEAGPHADEQSAKEAETRLVSQISDLNDQINVGQRTPRGKPGPVNTPYIQALREIKNAKMEVLDAISPQWRKTDEGRISLSEKSLDRAIARMESAKVAGFPEEGPKGSAAWSPRIAAQRAELDALRTEREQVQALRNPKATPEELRNIAFRARTERKIADLEKRMATEDFAKKKTEPLVYDKASMEVKFQLDKAIERFHAQEMKWKLARRSPLQKVGAGIAETVQTARAVMTSLDVSAVLRQGGFITIGNPRRAARSIGSMFRALASDRGAHAVQTEIQARPNAVSGLYKKSGLYLSESGGTLAQMEEAYMSRWANIAIKVMGKDINPVAASQRAYTTFLNKLRADSFDAMVSNLGTTGRVSDAEARAIADFVNVATGRGHIGLSENAAVGLNTVFFAPRLVASRFNILLGQPIVSAAIRARSPRAVKMIAGEYAKFLIGLGVVYSLAMFMGADVEDDPRSTDFGKIRIGDTRIDPLTGLQQVTVLTAREVTGTTRDAKGDILPLRAGYRMATPKYDKVPYGRGGAFEIGTRFMRTKFSPVFGAAVDLATGSNVAGKPVTPGGAALRLVIPMAGSDLYQAIKAQGVPVGIAIGLVGLFGAGVSTYSKTNEHAKDVIYRMFETDGFDARDMVMQYLQDLRVDQGIDLTEKFQGWVRTPQFRIAAALAQLRRTTDERERDMLRSAIAVEREKQAEEAAKHTPKAVRSAAL